MGVEWDLSSRGKHSGDHEGIQYFTCRYYSQEFYMQQPRGCHSMLTRDCRSSFRLSVEFNTARGYKLAQLAECGF